MQRGVATVEQILYAVIYGFPAHVMFAVKLSATAVSGNVAHCTAHPGTHYAQTCYGDESLPVDIQVQ